MAATGKGARLIIVCGLPGSGKTTHARQLEEKLRVVRFAPDEWMDALSIDIYDEARRAKIEALQWKLSQELLALGLTVIIEWGTWGRSGRDALRLGARTLGAAVELHYLSAPRTSCSREFSAGEWRIRQFSGRRCCNGPRLSRRRRPTKWLSSTRLSPWQSDHAATQVVSPRYVC